MLIRSEDVQQGAQHTGAAVGKERLCPQGEDQLCDSGDKGQASQHPGCGDEGDVWLGDADDAEDDEEKACDAEPNLGTCFHDEYWFWPCIIYRFQQANLPICSDMANKSTHLRRLRAFAAGLSFVK